MKLTHVDMSRNPGLVSGVTDVIASGGVVLNPNKTYRVTVNEFLAKGGDHFTLLKDGLNRKEGGSEIEALAAYLENFKYPQAGYDPDDANLNKPRIIQLPLP
jgi:5'-nucleotidase